MNLENKIVGLSRHVKVFNKTKIFGVGSHKTGTTSLKAAMEEMGFITGKQKKAEALVVDWGKRDFSNIIKYCYSAQFFQDTPFCLAYTYVALDQAFPGSKFILTIRDNPEQWYNSYVNYQIKKRGQNGNLPTKEDLQNDLYVYKGMNWEAHRLIFPTPEDDLYNKEILIDVYESHNKAILEYFRHRPEDLLVLNVSEKDSYTKLAGFLGVQTERKDFPWKNKTHAKK